MKKINLILLTSFTLLLLSCETFLNETPDNRATVNRKDKIKKLLISAYPSTSYTFITELSSDNVYDMGDSFKSYSINRVMKSIAYWKDQQEENGENSKSLWKESYESIAHANEALAAIEKLGDNDLSAEKGEALIARAYSHFVLVNVFCMAYNSQTSDTDLGIPYMNKPEKTLNPQYNRGTVKEVYEKINKDIEAALPLINDEIYQVPLYHFTKKAAYAFAARFNLYYEKWEKAKEYATKVLGANPRAVIRDWSFKSNFGGDQTRGITDAYINAPANLFAHTAYSSLGLIFGRSYYGSIFAHSRLLAYTETVYSSMPFDNSLKRSDYHSTPNTYTGDNIDKVLLIKIPSMFEYTDPVANIGYWRSVLVPFTTDESLLVRAEAKIMLGDNAGAMDDLNIWTAGFFKDKKPTTIAKVNDFYSGSKQIPYSTAKKPTQKKKLNPKFTIPAGSENMIHYLLQCRRLLTLHEGLRWFDIKRYGIEVNRRKMNIETTDFDVEDTLKPFDLRTAVQIPQDVVSAGMKPNPR